MNDQTLNIKFVQEVEKYPCLYNYKLSDYSKKDVTDRAWSDVGKIFNMTESQSKEKWKNLRAVFVRHIKPAPSGSSSKNKKAYYLADAMQFTIPYIKALNMISGNLPQEAVREVMDLEDKEVQQNIPSPSQNIASASQNMASSSQNMPSPSQNSPSSFQNIPSPMSCPLPASSPIYNHQLSPMLYPSSRPSALSTNIRSNRRKGKPLSTVDDGIMDYFKAKKAKLEKKN